MSRIPEWLDEIKRRLNPNGEGYRVGECADELVDKARVGCGFLNEEVRDLLRTGAIVKTREHDMTRVGKAPKASRLSRAVAAMAEGQGDFDDLVDDFKWMTEETSLDDTVDAIRKAYADLTLGEAKLVVKLKTKKAAETQAAAERIQHFIDDHPEWESDPYLTMGEIAGLD